MNQFHYYPYKEDDIYYFSLCKNYQKENDYFPFTKEHSYLIFLHKEFIGLFSFIPFAMDKIEMNLWILPEYRNHGLGTKVAKELSEFIFKIYPNFKDILLYIPNQNNEAIKSAEKAGFTFNHDSFQKRMEDDKNIKLHTYKKSKSRN